MRTRQWTIAAVIGALFMTAAGAQAQPLASWNDGATKQSIIDFVERVSDSDSPDFVPVAERIAVFDNDGTLWAEQPAYFQLLFAMDRVRSMAVDHPKWMVEQPYRAAIEGDIKEVMQSGERGLIELVMASHADMTTDQFADRVRNWLSTARHPTTRKPYTEMVYQPMLELLDYLRANDFKTFIVSGGGIEFLRVFAEEVYGVPPEQVIGSSITTEFEMTDDGPVLRRIAALDFINDKAGKPVAINRYIGRRPIAAFGNSDGDHQMLQWTAAGEGARLMLLVHHTDEQREWAYGRESHIGRLDAALDQAQADGWVVVDMKADWLTVFDE